MKKTCSYLILIVLLLTLGCQQKNEVKMQLDHVILAIDDLDSGIEEFEELTGIKAAYGGGHEHGNTHNAIVALDNKIYLEILAPKDDLDTIPEFFKNMSQLKPIGFALSVDDIDLLENSVKKYQFKTGGIEDWSRVKPNGDKLEWKLLRIYDPAFGINPFFIDWSETTIHPSLQMNSAGALLKLEITTPYKDEIEKVMSDAHSRIETLKLNQGDSVELSVEIQTPKGRISL